jgi:Zn-finger nucleic acid-binding protein
LKCPTCTTPLTHRSLARQEVDLCPACGGLWADAGELAALIRGRSPGTGELTESEAPPFDPNCPRCSGRLAPFEYAHDSGVTIAKCNNCGGLWLSAAQLDQLARYRASNPAVDRLAAALADDHHRARRWEFARSLLHSKVMSGGVAAAYLVAGVVTTGELRSVLSTLGFLILPLACIWFSDGMGKVTGVSGALARPRITHKTPGIAVAIGGWIVLLTPALMRLLV